MSTTRRFRSIVLVASLGASALASAMSAAPVAAGSVPPGFVDELVAGSLSRPTAVEWLPDGTIVVLEQGGRVEIGDLAGNFTTALSIADICSNAERGLLGFAHDPGFGANGFVYLYYTRQAPSAPGGCVSRVSRFTFNGASIDPASEAVLLDNISSVNTNHNGGDLDIGSDGYLYVSVGDAGRDPRGDSGSAGGNDAAQDLSLLNGKILRITLDGKPAPGNPLPVDATTTDCATRGNTASTPLTGCREIFAWGLRNPYRFAFDRNDGSNTFFINDVGQGTREEVDLGRRGANYGWPVREGRCAQGQTPPCAPPSDLYTDPLTDYGRSTGQYITAGAFVPNGLWHPDFDGKYLFGDGGSGKIWVMGRDGSVDYGAPLVTGVSGLTDMTFGFDASGRAVLYYVQVGGSLRKITPPARPAPPLEPLKMIPIAPFRAYDTGDVGIDSIGVAPGDVYNGTSRQIALHPPVQHAAALVNITYSGTKGPGFVRAWGTRQVRPPSSTLNADAANGVGANTTIVTLDQFGTFVLEATMTGRIVVDVLAWFDATSGPVADGRYVALSPARLVDTRIAPGTTLSSGADNPYVRNGSDVTVTTRGRVGIPDDATVGSVVLSVAAVAGTDRGGWVGAFPTGGTWPGSSNVNVTPGDQRANLVIVPLGTGGQVTLRAFNVADVVVDVVGYVTSASASSSTSGRYLPAVQTRIVDTRESLGFGRLQPDTVPAIAVPDSSGAAAVVQNVTVVSPVNAGWLATFPLVTDPPFVSTVNYSAAGQIRANLAFTTLPASRQVGYRTLNATDLVVDVIGTFTA